MKKLHKIALGLALVSISGAAFAGKAEDQKRLERAKLQQQIKEKEKQWWVEEQNLMEAGLRKYDALEAKSKAQSSADKLAAEADVRRAEADKHQAEANKKRLKQETDALIKQL